MIILEYNGTVINVPQGWHEITLGAWEDVHAIKPETDAQRVEYLAKLCQTDIETLREFPAEVFNLMVEHSRWVFEEMGVRPSKFVEVEGVKYFINPEDKITLGEWVDVEEAQKSENGAILSNVLAILCRPVHEEYSYERNEARQQLFAAQPASKMLPILAFILECSEQLGKLKKTYADLLALSDQLQRTGHILRVLGHGIRSFRIWPTMIYCVSTLLLRYQLRRYSRISSTPAIKIQQRKRRAKLIGNMQK